MRSSTLEKRAEATAELEFWQCAGHVVYLRHFEAYPHFLPFARCTGYKEGNIEILLVLAHRVGKVVVFADDSAVGDGGINVLADDGIVEQFVRALVGDNKRLGLCFARLEESVVLAIGKHLLEDGDVVHAAEFVFYRHLPKADEVGSLDFGLRTEGQTDTQREKGTEEDFFHGILVVNDYG